MAHTINLSKNDIEWGLDSNYVIIATYASFTNDKFQSILRAIAKDMILIADEAHNVGATHVRKAFACMPIEKGLLYRQHLVVHMTMKAQLPLKVF